MDSMKEDFSAAITDESLNNWDSIHRQLELGIVKLQKLIRSKPKDFA